MISCACVQCSRVHPLQFSLTSLPSSYLLSPVFMSDLCSDLLSLISTACMSMGWVICWSLDTFSSATLLKK